MYNGAHTNITTAKQSIIQAIMTAHFRVDTLQYHRVKAPAVRIIVQIRRKRSSINATQCDPGFSLVSTLTMNKAGKDETLVGSLSEGYTP